MSHRLFATCLVALSTISQSGAAPAVLNPALPSPAVLDTAVLDPVLPVVLNPVALDPGALNPGALNPGALNPGALNPVALNPAGAPVGARTHCAPAADATTSPARNPRPGNPASAEHLAIRNFFKQHDFGLLPGEVDELGRLILCQSERNSLDPKVILALIAVESSGNPSALSHAGARGLMQLRPETARAESDRLGLLWKGDNTLFDPLVNVELGINYLSQLVKRFGDLETALVAYNWGPTRIARSLHRGSALPNEYRHRVMSELASLSVARA